MEKELQARSGGQCELCKAKNELNAYEVPPAQNLGLDAYIHICATCQSQIEDPTNADAQHWRCLNESMWSEVPGVQVVAWRMLHHLRGEGWSQDLLDMLYLDDANTTWAQAGLVDLENQVIHKDSNGNILEAGDTVTLIQDLKVKGANFTAKRGAAVRRISLVADNAEHIEGKVDGQHIVILTKYVKKSK